MHDHIYKSPIKVGEYTNDLNTYLGALGFTQQVELLSLKVVSSDSLLNWLSEPTGPHLMTAGTGGDPYTALAILWTPESLYNSKSAKVGIGLVYKAPYIRAASFSEAYFSLMLTHPDQRTPDPSLMFIQIAETSQVIPHPAERHLFLDVKHPDFITNTNVPRSPQVFRGFKLHKVLLVTKDSKSTEVAVPRLDGEDTIRMITYQKVQIVPKYHMAGTIDVPLAVATDDHWNLLRDPMFPKCLDEFKQYRRYSKRYLL